MNTSVETRYASSPQAAKTWDTAQTREALLITPLFIEDQVKLVYSHYDRFITGGVMPVKKAVKLETVDPLKAEYFLERRELGIINTGGAGKVSVDGEVFEIGFKEALYIGKGKKEIVFSSNSGAEPARFYINSTPAHMTYPTRRITRAEADVVTLGAQ